MRLATVMTDEAPAAVGPYSQAVAAGGLLFVSGQLPLVPGSGEIRAGTVTDQARQALTNALAVVRQAGLQVTDIAKTTVFLTDLAAYGEMNEVYESFFGGWRPARSVVEVAGLPRGAQVEVEVVAELDRSGSGAPEGGR
ncbi:MAG: Rid family detoxifying hydrolase [Candidatus Dormibacteraceae bacterium]